MKQRTKQTLRYRQIATIFARTGSQSFGGWTSTALLLEKELIHNRQVLSQGQLKSATTYAQILPGATQVAIVANIGHQLRGTRGAIVATISYLAPVISLIIIFSAVYFHAFRNGSIGEHLDGLTAALAGIILANAYRMGSKHVSHPLLWVAVIAAGAGQYFMHINVIFILATFGIAGLAAHMLRSKRQRQ